MGAHAHTHIEHIYAYKQATREKKHICYIDCLSITECEKTKKKKYKREI